MKTLIAIPLFNEEKTIKKLIGLIKKYTGSDILIIDDGSSDNSVKILRSVKNIKLLRNSVRKGYGSTLQKIFDFSIKNNYKYLITLDADLQHEPLYIPEFMKFIQRYDIVSGSRYLKNSKIKSPAPEKRRYVNLIITKIINRITNYNLTDSFCGFKGYKVESLRKIRLSSKGLAAPLELLLKAYQYGLLIREIPVSLIYFKSRRDFQGKMSNMNYRINYYKKTIIKVSEKLIVRK